MKIKETEYLPMTYLRSLLARKVMLHTWKQLKKVIVWQMQRQTYPLKIYCVVSTFLWLSSWQSTSEKIQYTNEEIKLFNQIELIHVQWVLLL